ncbi:tRNA (adenosine(37)-N6)-threonylcarbamoyltransferase complex dimerization subunit type 1 TsaB [Paramagnetospirillum kuznetsovii]|uniref:N(6)-L-threonylcarbamoyladenine synthase n=1 Tax=Paramagnetospirillum kuznetsovii TaxID=2053833 RepID=A0A364P3U1_9PROT|nr:tRNA (adenosine(37)-N6)-threonylcarbamoyltransferase complex dimerization subunit type 1 TsaB [Paramagnetospirillum kuznetsovii]RAU23827.1 tRNA (adenosine(37)-N6)-threonylcarbamoyltransferase complex dimerization subunit type 1 TsaB [Paramagnetospirillum kuznetsovii]
MIVLAMDTSTSACSVALWRDGTVVAHRLRRMARGQSEALMPMVAEVMAESGLEFAGAISGHCGRGQAAGGGARRGARISLDLLAVTVGPGAFTGLRIGLAAARGLALASGLPLAGVSTPLAVAAAVPGEERRGRTVLAVIDSRRDELWVQAFAEDLTPLGEVAALLPAQAARLADGPVVVAGDAASAVLDHCADGVASLSPGWPDAAVVAALAAEQWAKGTSLAAEPLYLRPPDVTL